MKCKTNEIGRSMIEMLGVLAIMAVLSIGGIWGYNRATKVMRVNAMKNEISTLVAQVRAMYFARDDYKELTETTMIGAGFVPDTYLSADGKSIVNPYKGSILVGSVPSPTMEDGAFVLVFNGLDAVTCREIAALSWGSDISTGFMGMTIKNDGDLTVADSNLTDPVVTTGNSTFRASDLPQALLIDTYETCNCGEQNTCAIAWKFI